MRGLYAIVDVVTLQARGLEVVSFADAVLSARPAAIQLRDKRQNSRATLALLRELNALARRREVPLFANDRADLAALAGCAGLHVGQHDLPPGLARQVASALGARPRLGLSIHTPQQLTASENEALDYLAFGPVFPTRSKHNPEPVLGLDGLRALAEAAAPRKLPCVAIGGIGLENAAQVAKLCDCAAVIGALMPTATPADNPLEQVAERAATLHQRLGGSPTGPRWG